MPLFRYWSLLRRYLRPQRAKVCGLAVLLFGEIGLQLVNPQILRYVVDAAREGASLPHLVQAAACFLGVAAAAYPNPDETTAR